MTVILANGDFPSVGGEGWRLLAEAERVVACDGAAVAYRRAFGRLPDFTVGDFDSIGDALIDAASSEGFVSIPEQDTNDLEKAIRFCRVRGWQELVIVGASGGREDHLLGNVFRAMASGVDMVTDRGRFVPFVGRREFAVRAGAAVSVFAPNPDTDFQSSGLEWPLAGVKFDSLYRGTLNRATSPQIVITASHQAFVFIEAKQNSCSWPLTCGNEN